MKIAVMGDLHYVQQTQYHTGEAHTPAFIEARDRFFERYINGFFDVAADYYVSVGDLTNFGTADELSEVYQLIRKHDKTFIHTLGNHDLYTMTRQAVCEQVQQHTNYSIDTPEATLIFWETAREMDEEIYGGTVTAQQLAWLEEELLASGDKTVFVFGHHPIYDTTHHSNYENLSIDPSIDVASVLRKKEYGQAFYICGHTHYDSIVQHENWTYVQIAAVLDVPAMRVINVQQGNVTVTAQTVLTAEYQHDAAIIAEQMDFFEGRLDGAGTTLTRNIVVPTAVPSSVR